MASVFPLLSKFKSSNDKNRFNNLFRNSFFIAIIFSLFIMLVSYIYAPLIINIFGGKEFVESIVSLRILVFAVPLLFINNLLYYRFLIKRNLLPIILTLILGLILNCVLNVIYVPQYGYIASSFITVLTEFFLFFLLVLTIISQNYRRDKNA